MGGILSFLLGTVSVPMKRIRYILKVFDSVRFYPGVNRPGFPLVEVYILEKCLELFLKPSQDLFV